MEGENRRRTIPFRQVGGEPLRERSGHGLADWPTSMSKWNGMGSDRCRRGDPWPFGGCQAARRTGAPPLFGSPADRALLYYPCTNATLKPACLPVCLRENGFNGGV
jgi:hypothetical protein